MSRNNEIVKTSIFGIAGNVFLSALKFVIGFFTNSPAIWADALNNITDALSSVITIVGTRLSERQPDRKHPFGYGRLEYVTALTIGILILYAGIHAVTESIHRIVEPEPSEYTTASMVIVAVAVLVKIVMGVYFRRKGKELESTALDASGKDALDDSVETAATFIAAVIFVKTGVSLEAYVGLAISILIFRTGIETLRETISSILGERVDPSIITEVRNSILSFPEVDGVYDVVIHNYGRDKLYGSAHVELPDAFSAGWIDNLQRAITSKVRVDTGVEMLGITIYAENSKDAEAMGMKENIKSIVSSVEPSAGMYGFYLDKIDKEIKFNIVTDFDVKDVMALHDIVEAGVLEMYPEYDVSISMKRDITG